MERFLLLFGVRFVTAGIVAVLASMVAALYYVDIAGIEHPDEVMRGRPSAPGSAAALLAEHSDHCWADGALEGPLTGVLAREEPNDPYVYASSVDRTHDDLFIRAIEQTFEGKDRGVDRVIAFCSAR